MKRGGGGRWKRTSLAAARCITIKSRQTPPVLEAARTETPLVPAECPISHARLGYFTKDGSNSMRGNSGTWAPQHRVFRYVARVTTNRRLIIDMSGVDDRNLKLVILITLQVVLSSAPYEYRKGSRLNIYLCYCGIHGNLRSYHDVRCPLHTG
jgi:hypothetical protein